MECPYCKKDELKLTVYNEKYPWSVSRYQCPTCNTTFTIQEVEEIEESKKKE